MSHQETKNHPFTPERLIGGFLFVAALAMYLASLSWTPFPGLPTRELLQHLGLPEPPPALDMLWGWLVRGFVRLPGLPLAAWAGLFSAFCGAVSVGLLGLLMMRVKYRGWKNLSETHAAREIQARRLSGLVAGLYLACCIPFWVVSTRSLPGAFHVLLLLSAAWWFSAYQQGGKLRYLGLLGVVYGVGMTEFATCLLFLPLAIFLVGRELYRRRSLLNWRPHLCAWGGLGLGLMVYPFNAYVLFRESAPWGLFASPWQAWARILQDQLLLIAQIRLSPGFLVIMFFCLVPWLMLFAMSRRSPWYYETDQVAVRLVFTGGLLGVLYSASFAPWSMLGMVYLLVTPHVLLAICMGYMAGEFWILGEVQELGDAARSKRIARHAASVFACSLPFFMLLAGGLNWRVADGRHGRLAESTAMDILDRLADRNIVLSSGLLDDSLRLAIWERKAPVQLISAPMTPSPVYLRHLAKSFGDDPLSQPLAQCNFGAFLEALLMSDDGPARTCIIDLPDAFREFGYLVPDGFAYRLEPTADRVDIKSLVEAQRPFWKRMEQLATQSAPEKNLIRTYQDMLRVLASKVANNLGVMQAERGDEDGALDTFRTARKIYPDNLSVLLNLMELGRTRNLPEQAELDADWAARQDQPDEGRWALAARFGYVWKAREWVRRGWVWALSGAPTTEEAARRHPPAIETDTEALGQLLDLAYLQWGAPYRSENAYRAMLVKDGKDTAALMSMCRLALRRKDPEAADSYMAEAMAMGLPEAGVLFDRAMAVYVRGDQAQAVAALEELARQTPGDARVWMALVLLTDEQNPVNRQALKTLENLNSTDVGVPLSLAFVQMSRYRWAEAQVQLELALQLAPKNIKAWETMATLARIRGNRKMAEIAQRTLLLQDPSHPIQHMQKAHGCYERKAWAEAEAELRSGLRTTRNPDLLFALANLILEQNGDLNAARGFADEALRKQPFNPIFLCTRAELNMKTGHLDEAATDLRQALAAMPDHVLARLLSIELHADRGETQAAIDLARGLADQREDLSPEQRADLKKLLVRIRRP
jgi:tetratricopeptide (TPR) repeat protein